MHVHVLPLQPPLQAMQPALVYPGMLQEQLCNGDLHDALVVRQVLCVVLPLLRLKGLPYEEHARDCCTQGLQRLERCEVCQRHEVWRLAVDGKVQATEHHHLLSHQGTQHPSVPHAFSSYSKGYALTLPSSSTSCAPLADIVLAPLQAGIAASSRRHNTLHRGMPIAKTMQPDVHR